MHMKKCKIRLPLPASTTHLSSNGESSRPRGTRELRQCGCHVRRGLTRAEIVADHFPRVVDRDAWVIAFKCLGRVGRRDIGLADAETVLQLSAYCGKGASRFYSTDS